MNPNTQGYHPYAYGNLLTPWQQLQQMYSLQSTMLQDQKKLIMKEDDIYIVKFFFINEEENRRVKVEKDTDYKGLFKYIRHYINPYHKLKGIKIDKMQYEDEEGDWLNFSSQNEWEDCIRIRTQIKKTNIIKIRVFTVAPEIKIEEIPEEMEEIEVKIEEEEEPKKEVEKEKYKNQMLTLFNMGFYNKEENMRVLEKFDGNMDLVMKELMKI